MRTVLTVLTAVALLAPAWASGEDPPKAQPPKTIPTVTAVSRGGARIKDTITVTVKGLHQWLAEDAARTADLVLYLDHIPLAGQQKGGASPDKDQAAFLLDTIPDARNNWFLLLRRPGFEPRKVTLGVGPRNGSEWPSTVNAFELATIEDKWFWPWAAFFAAFLAALAWLGRKTDLLRDSGDPPASPRPGSRRAFSLARVQMAWWTLLVSGAFAFIFSVTWTTQVEPGVLVLMGISAATGLTAHAIDSGKTAQSLDQREKLDGEKAQLIARGSAASAEEKARLAQVEVRLAALEKQIQAPPSRGFWLDLVSDFQGPALPRFQMLLWTIILGVYFAIQVAWDLTMPVFDQTLLVLMGISSGVYLGFKFPEKPTP